MTETELAQVAPMGDGMIAVAQTREAQAIQAAMVIAQHAPRNIVKAEARIVAACQRLRLAEASMYMYSRGGTRIEGPSIRLAEVMAQNWGNIDAGLIEVAKRRGESDMQAYCWDLETNTRITKTFTVPHERHSRKGVTKLEDPRDIYENNANMGARRLRACILAVIPGDVQDAAIDACKKTLAGGGTEPLIDRIKRMVEAFAAIGVTQEMLEAKLQHNMESTAPLELVTLRQIYQSINDGMSTPDAWFTIGAPEPGQTRTDALAAKLTEPQDGATAAKAAEQHEKLADAEVKPKPAEAAADDVADSMPLSESIAIQFRERGESLGMDEASCADAWTAFVKIRVAKAVADCIDEDWHLIGDWIAEHDYNPTAYTS